jgi:hypothetical protein
MEVGRVGRLGKTMLVVVLAVGLSAVAGCQGETKKDDNPLSQPLHFTKKWTYKIVAKDTFTENQPTVVRTVVYPGLKFVYYNDHVLNSEVESLYVKVITTQGTTYLGSMGNKMTSTELNGVNLIERLSLFGEDVFKLNGMNGSHVPVTTYVKYDGKGVLVHQSDLLTEEKDLDSDGTLEVIETTATVTSDVASIYKNSKSGGIGANPMKELKLHALVFNGVRGTFQALETAKQKDPTEVAYQGGRFVLAKDREVKVKPFAYTAEKISDDRGKQVYIYEFGKFVHANIKPGMTFDEVEFLLSSTLAPPKISNIKDGEAVGKTSAFVYLLPFDPAYATTDWKSFQKRLIDANGFSTGKIGAQVKVTYSTATGQVIGVDFYYVNPEVSADGILYHVNSDGSQDMTSIDGSRIYD